MIYVSTQRPGEAATHGPGAEIGEADGHTLSALVCGTCNLALTEYWE